MAGHLLFNSGSNESSLAPQFKWLDNTFKNSVLLFHLVVVGWPCIGGAMCPCPTRNTGTSWILQHFCVFFYFRFFFFKTIKQKYKIWMKRTNLLHLFCFLSSPRQACTMFSIYVLLVQNFSSAWKGDYECRCFLCGNRMVKNFSLA
jgi:hypothetical protein